MALLYAYNFDEASGNILDQSGNGLDTVFGGSLSRSASGHTSKGITQTSAAADSAGPSITGLQTANCTLMGWVFRTDNTVIGWFGEIKSGGSGNRGILLGLSGNVGFRCRNSGGTAQTPSVAQPAVSGWWHVAGTWDGANVKLFINGVQVASTALTGAPHTSGTGSHLMDTLGAETIVDDVRYYDTALDAATITTLMGTPVTGASTVTGTITGDLPALTSSIASTVRVSGTAAGNLPAMTGSITGRARVSGTGSGTLPTFTGSVAGSVRASGSVTGILPALTGALTGNVAAPATPVTGTLSGSLPGMTAALVGTAGPVAPPRDLTLAGVLEADRLDAAIDSSRWKVALEPDRLTASIDSGRWRTGIEPNRWEGAVPWPES